MAKTWFSVFTQIIWFKKTTWVGKPQPDKTIQKYPEQPGTSQNNSKRPRTTPETTPNRPTPLPLSVQDS